MDPGRITRRRLIRTSLATTTLGLAGCELPATRETPSGDTTTPTATDAKTDTPNADTDAATGTTTETTTAEPTTPTDPPSLNDLSVRADRIAQGFSSPVAIEIPEPGRRFIVDQQGEIYLQDGTGVRNTPFLDVRDRMVNVDGYSEQGLLGLAFHPEFTDNGRFYVRYSAPPREGTPDEYSHTFVLSEFTADPEGTTADTESERTVLEIPQPQSNHNAGSITFGPDGYLYVGVGDGGGANDQGTGHVDDWYDDVAGGNGQDVTENLLGSILRIDVDKSEDGRPYAIPEDNPLVGRDGLDEQYAWGFRNPWRMSFSPDGRLFAADVGQGAWEEVSIVRKGGNYGWNVREGAHCFQSDACPTETADGQALVDPVIEYPHGGAPVSGISVIGGYLYDGDDLPDFEGVYLFADWRASGQLFAAAPGDSERWNTATVSVEGADDFGPNVLSFGRNPDGELFVCTTGSINTEGKSGRVYRLRSA